MSSIEDIVTEIQSSGGSKNELYSRIYKLLYMFCNKYTAYAIKRGFAFEDLLAFAWLGVEKAIESYSTNRGMKFTTFLTFHVKSAISRGIRHDAPEDDLKSLSDPIHGADDLTLADTIADEKATEEIELAEECDYYNVLHSEVAKLPPEQRDAIVQKFMNGESLRSIAERAGVSSECIRQRQQKGLRRLKTSRQLKECYYDAVAYRHIGVQRFNRTWTSSTELAALEHMREVCEGMRARNGKAEYDEPTEGFDGRL